MGPKDPREISQDWSKMQSSTMSLPSSRSPKATTNTSKTLWLALTLRSNTNSSNSLLNITEKSINTTDPLPRSLNPSRKPLVEDMSSDSSKSSFQLKESMDTTTG